MPRPYASPPMLTVVGGTDAVALSQLSGTDDPSANSSSPSSFSIIIVIIVIASAIIASASLYLLLRLISRRCHRSFSRFSPTDDVVSTRNADVPQADFSFHGSAALPDDLLGSLPLFAFDSLAGNVAGGDCAVCLSKFEPHDQLRLLPLCCHAFHARCIDSWLVSNQTCPLCRSTVQPTESDILNKILWLEGSNSFRIEIGNVSRRRGTSDSADDRRSFSIGSFDYIVDDGHEVPVESTRRQGISDRSSLEKEPESNEAPTNWPVAVPEPPGQNVAAEVAGGRSRLRDYVDRVASISLSSRALSFRGSGRFFSGSSRRSDTVVPVDDLEAIRLGEEISELFRWLSGV